MKTYPVIDERSGQTMSFQIDNVYVSPADVGRILARVPDVANVQVRPLFGRWGEVRVRFTYKRTPCVVWEPHGDNSLYWIGAESEALHEPLGLAQIASAFEEYSPPLLRKVVGDLLSLEIFKRVATRERK